jgi:hypothetical protein
MLYKKAGVTGTYYRDAGTTAWRRMWSWARFLGIVWLA